MPGPVNLDPLETARHGRVVGWRCSRCEREAVYWASGVWSCTEHWVELHTVTGAVREGSGARLAHAHDGAVVLTEPRS